MQISSRKPLFIFAHVAASKLGVYISIIKIAQPILFYGQQLQM